MSINWLLLGGHQSQKREVIPVQDSQTAEVITECYCTNGHSVLSDEHKFKGHPGLTLKLKSKTSEGLLIISPVLGDRDRRFIDFERKAGDVVDICCPTCSEPFPYLQSMCLWRTSGGALHLAQGSFCPMHRYLPAPWLSALGTAQ